MIVRRLMIVSTHFNHGSRTFTAAAAIAAQIATLVSSSTKINREKLYPLPTARFQGRLHEQGDIRAAADRRRASFGGSIASEPKHTSSFSPSVKPLMLAGASKTAALTPKLKRVGITKTTWNSISRSVVATSTS
ncbi:hypothetical protein O1611_g9936 [Lasiodiplodia mahajangana]|uniref:Uncharacterized protein n=1 Tax=Lasiodiplodia mahajangana TaxID=1108764 RepID=A0ACC2J3M2_9PEZI|nr:hypothetical protein O1611_g9936 [Lasiodiplodia mahajangana]